LADTLLVFSVAAGVIIIGYLANVLFRKTGWPEILFLIFTGILVGPVLNLFSKDSLLPVLPLISTFTLLMVLFRGGMELDISEIAAGSVRALFQTTAYFTVGMTLIALFTHFVLGWQLIEGFILGSMISQTGEVVIIPMVKKLRIQDQSAALLSIESVMSSIFAIVFFSAFLATTVGQVLSPVNILTSIVTRFSVGIIIGIAMGIPWLRILFAFEKNELTYIATLGYILLGYVVSETFQGNGPLTVLAFGIIIANDKEVLHVLRMKEPPSSFSEVKAYLNRFQTEISFILRAFFFVMLGLIFDTSQSGILTGLGVGIPVVAILLITRYTVVSASTWRSSMVSEKKIIVGMCALGLTPALLSFLVLQSSLPNAYLFPLVVTNAIIITNIITSASSFMHRRAVSLG
jgi:cell volume regulation protein A